MKETEAMKNLKQELFDAIETICKDYEAKHLPEPISQIHELSDEEIDMEAKSKSLLSHYPIVTEITFNEGAKWYRDKLRKHNEIREQN